MGSLQFWIEKQLKAFDGYFDRDSHGFRYRFKTDATTKMETYDFYLDSKVEYLNTT